MTEVILYSLMFIAGFFYARKSVYRDTVPVVGGKYVHRLQEGMHIEVTAISGNTVYYNIIDGESLKEVGLNKEDFAKVFEDT